MTERLRLELGFRGQGLGASKKLKECYLYEMEPWLETTIGLIMMVVLGPAVGNYATSVVYRLPFGQTPFEKKPYCGHCNTMLQPRDLFPILSYLLARGKCRYCQGVIRASYIWVEVVCGALFIINYLTFGISETFIMVTTIGVFLTILSALEYHERKLFDLILTYLFGLGALLQTLQTGTIYSFFYSGFIMLFAGVVIWRASGLFNAQRLKQVPDYVWLMVLIGIIVPQPLLIATSALTLGLVVIQRVLFGKITATIPVSLAIYAALLV